MALGAVPGEAFAVDHFFRGDFLFDEECVAPGVALALEDERAMRGLHSMVQLRLQTARLRASMLQAWVGQNSVRTH